MIELYLYKAKVRSVYDGDTFRADIDLGFEVFNNNTAFRLARIDTPEIRGEERPEGLKAKERVVDLIGGEEILIRSVDKGKYGRWIAEVYLFDGEDGLLVESTENLTNLNDLLVEEDLAEYVDYE